MRLIDADDLKKTWYKEHNIEPGESGAMFVGNNEVPTFIDRARTIEPVRHGRWIVGDSLPMHDIAGNLSWGNWYTCNQCEFKTYAIERHITQYNYCPNCGAKMDGERKDNE